MYVYTMNFEDLQKHANSVLMTVVNGLSKEKLLTEKERSDILTNYSIIVEKDTWLPDWLVKVLKLKENAVTYRLVKVINRKEDIDILVKEEKNA